MNLLQSIRRRRRRWVSQLLGVLAVVWLNMVLQPCLMAADMRGDATADSAADSGGHMDGHADGHMASHTDGHTDNLSNGHADGYCPHCPMQVSEKCGGVSAGCTYVDRVDYNGRSQNAKLTQEVPDESPVLLATLAAQASRSRSVCTTGPPPGGEPDPLTPPLNVLFCVYLN